MGSPITVFVVTAQHTFLFTYNAEDTLAIGPIAMCGINKVNEIIYE